MQLLIDKNKFSWYMNSYHEPLYSNSLCETEWGPHGITIKRLLEKWPPLPPLDLYI